MVAERSKRFYRFTLHLHGWQREIGLEVALSQSERHSGAAPCPLVAAVMHNEKHRRGTNDRENVTDTHDGCNLA
jgi:hypothetical protein